MNLPYLSISMLVCWKDLEGKLLIGMVKNWSIQQSNTDPNARICEVTSSTNPHLNVWLNGAWTTPQIHLGDDLGDFRTHPTPIDERKPVDLPWSISFLDLIRGQLMCWCEIFLKVTGSAFLCEFQVHRYQDPQDSCILVTHSNLIKEGCGTRGLLMGTEVWLQVAWF